MAKIPFSIDYRPQIESGEYKVVTGDDRPVRIISWNKKTYGGRTDIVALVHTSNGDTEAVQLYSPDGTLISSSCNEKFKLFIITPEPELTEFEADVMAILLEFVEEVDVNDVKRISKELLELAKKKLCKVCAANLEGYMKGRQDALKEKEMEEHRVYIYPTPHTLFPSCYHGGPCTNPMHDCINCPRQSTDGISTTTGTSAAKV